jgi:hypothetical protein
MTETTVAPSSLDETIATAFDQDTYTPYKVIGVVNVLLEKFGVDKKLPTQMGYQYASKGYIKSTKTTRTTKGGKEVISYSVSKEQAAEWAAKYVGAQFK